MNFILALSLCLFGPSAFALWPGFEQVIEAPRIPAGPHFWGTHWSDGEQQVEINQNGKIFLNSVAFSSGLAWTKSGESQFQPTVETGSWIRDGSTYCLIVERRVYMTTANLNTVLTMIETIFERPSSSGGYLCRVFPSWVSYKPAGRSEYVVEIDWNFIAMKFSIHGREHILYRHFENSVPIHF